MRLSFLSTISAATIALVTLAVATITLAAPAVASPTDCFGVDSPDLRIAGCTEMLNGRLTPEQQAQALASRALGYSLKGWYAESITDYDKSLAIDPNQAVALNNRAWAYFRWGKGVMGLDDIEKSIKLDASSGASWDTRAHINQSMGKPAEALADYRKAVNFGGPRMTKMYQCGLKEHGLYKGELDGKPSAELFDALSKCVLDTACDPLPADEECRFGTS
jgi:tetratricopeptide (TPR) repeat protein